MISLKSTTLVVLFAALGAQSLFAQGQSSGEDTQRRDQQRQQQQQQQQRYSSQTSGAGQYRSSPQSQPSQSSGSAGLSSSGSTQSNQSQTQSPAYPSTTVPSSNANAQSAQPGQSTSSQDAFRSDTSTSGGISAQAHGSGSSATTQSSQGAPAPGQSSSSASGRPGGTQSSANVQVNQQNVTQFQNVFSNWRPGANQEAQLTAAINATAPGGRINHEFVTRCVNDLNTVIPRAHLSAAAQQRLATAFAIVLTPSVEVTALEPALADCRQVLIESGLAPIQAQTVACDLHLMAAQVHPELLEVQVK